MTPHSLLFDSDSDGKSPSIQARVTSFAIALLALSVVLFAAFYVLQYQWNWSSVFRYKAKFLQGWLATLGISRISLIFSFLVGAIATVCYRSRFLPLKYLANLYVELIRGTPLLVQIYLFFYVIANAADIQNRYLVGVLIMAIFSGAYISEIFRAGIEGVGRSQLLSAKAIGFSEYQTFRYVIAPQALRSSLPALAGQTANLIKDSSLLSIIAISEFTLNAQEVNAFTYSSFESFFPLALGYLALTLPIMRLSRVLEKRLRFDT
ncbi:MAG: amino acid ABC transporter permease [Opitutales bacterium]